MTLHSQGVIGNEILLETGGPCLAQDLALRKSCEPAATLPVHSGQSFWNFRHQTWAGPVPRGAHFKDPEEPAGKGSF